MDTRSKLPHSWTDATTAYSQCIPASVATRTFTPFVTLYSNLAPESSPSKRLI